jgi:hypothetical protein
MVLPKCLVWRDFFLRPAFCFEDISVNCVDSSIHCEMKELELISVKKIGKVGKLFNLRR